MNCNECQELFTEYSRQLLGQAQLARFRDHLNLCPLCRQALQETGQLFAGLDSPETLAADSRQRILGELQQTARTAQNAVPVTGRSLFQRLWPSRPLWAGAYSCMLLLAGLVSGRLLPVNDYPTGSDTTATALICPVMSPASQWLPDTSDNTLT